MSILTVDEIHAVCRDPQSERELFDFASGITAALEKACNRVFAKRCSNATAATGTASATIPRHGLKVGQSIAVAAINAASHWDGITTVASVTGFDDFTFEIDSELASETAIEISIRPVRSEIKQTNGGSILMLHPRPVGQVTSVEVGKGDGTFDTALATAKYMLGDVTDGASYSGELVLFEGAFPTRTGSYRGGDHQVAGVRVGYVCGEPVVPPDLVYGAQRAMKSVWEKRLKKNTDLQSESYDYYSYSRMGAEQLRDLFGEFESIIRSHRLALM